MGAHQELSGGCLPGRVGVIGDVHAEDERLTRALTYFSTVRVEAVLCTGDVVDGYGSAERCCELLRDQHVVVVRGNHDRWVAQDTLRDLPEATPLSALSPASRDFLAALPQTRDFATPLGLLLLCHGIGTNDMARIGPDDFGYALETNGDLQALIQSVRYRLVVNGHSHRSMVRRFGQLTVINAGTLKRDNDPCVLVIDFSAATVSVLPFDRDGCISPEMPREYALSPP